MGATGRSSGNIGAVNAFHDRPDLAHHCVSFFRESDETENCSYHVPMRVTLVPPSKEENAQTLAKESSENGFDTTYLTAEEIDDQYPVVFDHSGRVGGIK